MPKTLLLADDSVTIQKVVGITFANEDVDLVTVDNGDVALARAREIKPDLILADVAMPGMSGYELCRTIKQDPELGHTPVVLLTGTFETFDAQRAADVGSDAHITKPFEAQALIDCVNALLSGSPSREEAVEASDSSSAPAPVLSGDLAEAAQLGPSDLPAQDAPPPWSGADPIQLEEVALEPQKRAFGQPLEFGKSTASATAPKADEPTASDSEPQSTAPLDPNELEASEPPPSLETLGERLDEALPAFRDASAMTEEDLGKTAYLDPEPLGGDPATAASSIPAESAFELLLKGPESTLGADAPSHPRTSPTDEAPTDSSLPGADALFDPTLRAQDLQGDLAPLLDPVPEDLEPTVAASETGVDLSPLPEPEPGSLGRTPPLHSSVPHAERAPGGQTDSGPRPGPVSEDALRRALEKAAWEAFGTISEEIVRETVRKIESIAWDLVPKIAERLVAEEIERLKAKEPAE